MTTNPASQSELELLRRLHRGAAVGLSALAKLHQRTQEDELHLHALAKLERRLTDRIEWMKERAYPTKALSTLPGD